MKFDKNILTPIIENLKKYSNRNAFCINDKFYTYEYLGNRISAIRTALQQLTYSNKNIGLVVNDDIDTYASIFAFWLEGSAYVPLHPGWPLERCEEIINQTSIELIVGSSATERFTKMGG